MGPPLDTPLCGAERVRKLNELERIRSGAVRGAVRGAVSEGYGKRCER